MEFIFAIPVHPPIKHSVKNTVLFILSLHMFGIIFHSYIWDSEVLRISMILWITMNLTKKFQKINIQPELLNIIEWEYFFKVLFQKLFSIVQGTPFTITAPNVTDGRKRIDIPEETIGTKATKFGYKVAEGAKSAGVYVLDKTQKAGEYVADKTQKFLVFLLGKDQQKGWSRSKKEDKSCTR